MFHMCRNEIEYYLFQVKPKMSKDTKMTPQDGKQNIYVSEEASHYQLLSDLLNKSTRKDKIFIKNELKIKPLLEVPKHSFKDECSPLAIIDLKLLQAAFQHFCEASDSADLQPFSNSNNQWKDRYFLSNKDLNVAGTSEESDLEKALSELQMSEISNNISDPEVLDFCNKEFSGKSLSESLYLTVPEEYSVLEPISITADSQEICGHGVIPEKLNCSLIKEEVNQKPILSKAVKRKKTTFGKRKKCKKKNSVFRNNVPNRIFERNVNSTESSENYFSMSEAQENELKGDEKVLCTAEEPNRLNAQEQQLGSTVPISPKDKVICKNDSGSKKKLKKKHLKTIIKVKIPKPPKISRKDWETPQEKLFKSPQVISKVKNPAITLLISKLEDCDKNSNKVIKSTKTVFQGQTPFQISEKLDKNTFNPNSSVSQSNSSNIIDAGSLCEIDKCDTEKQSVLSLDPHPLTQTLLSVNPIIATASTPQAAKEFTNSGNAPSDINFSKQDTLQKSVIQFSMCDDDISEKLDYEYSHPPSEKESTDSGKGHSDVDSSKQEILKNSVTESSTYREDIDENLDYEYDQLSNLSESESLSSPVPDTANNDQDSFGDEMLHSRESNRHSDYASNSSEPKVTNKESSGEVSNIQDNRDSSPKVTGSEGSNTIPEDMRSLADGPLDVSKDRDTRKRWVPSKKESGKKRLADFSDDDSTSDSEQSFKRRNNSSPSQCLYRNVHKEQVPPSRSSKLNGVPEQHFRKFNDVLEYIRNQCANHKIIEAVNIANGYLEISSNRWDRLKIFEEIFFNIKKSVFVIDDVPEEALKETFDKLKAFIDNPEAQKRDKGFCSKIIHEYFQHPLLIQFALDLCTFCRTKNIAINTRAAEAYSNNAITRNAPTLSLFNFLKYVRCVCNLNFPKRLLHYVLERAMRGKEFFLLSEFSELCDILSMMDAHELIKVPLQKLLDICVKNDCWEQIARFFIAWSAKRHFPNNLLQTFQSKPDETGMLFKEFAAVVYGNGKQDVQCKIFFGVLGIDLMLNAYRRGLMEKENPKNNYILSANDVLHTLNKYKINFFDLEKSWCNTKWVQKYLSVDSSTVIFFSFNVVFTAVEICLRLENPKDAFLILKNYSEKLREVPEILNKSKKLKIRAKHFNLFLEVTRLMHRFEPLDMSAFHELMSTLKQAGTFLDDLKESTDVDLKVIVTGFNTLYELLLTTYMNKSLILNVCELYRYTHGSFETLLQIGPLVLRGLVVTFAKHKKMVDAHTLFTSGCHKNIYQIEKPQPEELPWKVTIAPHWTSYEMSFVIERFLQKLCPFLATKKAKTKFEDWFTVKIAVKENPAFINLSPPKINCLIEPIPNPLARAGNSLKHIDPEFIWTEYEDCILLSPKKVYSYYVKNHTQQQGKGFSIVQSRPLAFGFGLDEDTAKNVNSSPSSVTHGSYDCNSSPINPHLSGEVSSTTSEHGHFLRINNSIDDLDTATKRRISFSSDRSSSHTPEKRLSAGERLNQPELKRPFPVGRSEPHPMSPHVHNDNPSNKRRRTVSSDMSELSNFACNKISPKHNSPFTPQSPFFSHLSPQKFKSPKRQNSNIVSPMYINKNSANALIKEYRHMAPSKSSLLTSPPKNTFGNPGPWIDESELPINNGNLDVFAPEEHVPVNYTIKTRSSGRSCVSKPFQSKKKKIVKRVEKSKTNMSQNSQEATSENTVTVKNSNPTTSNAAVMEQKTSTAVPSMTKHMSASSSLANHSKELSVFTVPPRSKLTAKRQLQMSKEVDHPKLPPYRIPTPCRQLKVVRPITPIVRSSTLRCKTPLSFQCGFTASQCIKRPLPLIQATSNKKMGILHGAVKETKGKMKFENFTVSFQKNSITRIVITPPAASRNSTITSKIKKGFNENPGTTRNTAIEEPSTSSYPVSNVNGGFAKPMFTDTKQASCNANVSENDFEKIFNFVKSKVLMKCRNIKEDQNLKKATTLANTFVQMNNVQRLDPKTMKKLLEFAKNHC